MNFITLLAFHFLKSMKKFRRNSLKNLTWRYMSVFKKLLKNVTCFVIYFKLAFLLKLGVFKRELTYLASEPSECLMSSQTQLSPVLLYLTDLDQFLHHWDVTEVMVHLKRHARLLEFSSSATNSCYVLALPCVRYF